MDKIFEKFGIYDFMGIWGPGALTVTYYVFTLRDFLWTILEKTSITSLGFSQKQLIIILYTAISYLIGAVLHELGKLLVDAINAFDIRCFLSNIEKCRMSKCKKKHLFTLFKNVKIETVNSFEQNLILSEFSSTQTDKPTIIGFEKALNDLKYNFNINTKRIDTYHSVYALSRSLFLCFAGNTILLLINCLILKNGINWCILIADIILSILFLIRTYRYFHTWVKNVYIQYYFEERRKFDELN